MLVGVAVKLANVPPTAAKETRPRSERVRRIFLYLIMGPSFLVVERTMRHRGEMKVAAGDESGRKR
jgi:hypothetical protein